MGPIMKGRFKASCQNLRGFLLFLYHLSLLWRALILIALFPKWHDFLTWIQAQLRMKFSPCKVTLSSNPGQHWAVKEIFVSGTLFWNQSVPTSEHAPSTWEHFLDQPVSVRMHLLTWRSSSQSTGSQWLMTTWWPAWDLHHPHSARSPTEAERHSIVMLMFLFIVCSTASMALSSWKCLNCHYITEFCLTHVLKKHMCHLCINCHLWIMWNIRHT